MASTASASNIHQQSPPSSSRCGSQMDASSTGKAASGPLVGTHPENTSGGSSQGEQGVQPNNNPPSVKQSLRDAVLQLVLDNVRADGYGGEVVDQVRRHFATLPTRYALSVDPRRHDDVLLHVRLLNEVREQCAEGSGGGGRNEVGPVVRVRRVGLAATDHSGESAGPPEQDSVVRQPSGAPRADQADATCPQSQEGPRVGMPIRQPGRHGRKRVDSGSDIGRSLPKPTFGSCINLSSLQHASPAKASRTSQRRSPHGVPVPMRRSGSSNRHSKSAPSRHNSILRGGGSRSSLDEIEAEEGGVLESPGSSQHGPGLSQHGAGSSQHGAGSSQHLDRAGESPGSSVHGGTGASSGGYSEGDLNIIQGWEVTVAAPDRPGLLTCFTSAICHSAFDLDIKEAHVFSSTDGFALQVFVVTNPRAQEETEEVEEGLQQLLKAKWEDKAQSRSTELSKVANLKVAVNAMCYEDWAVDPKDLTIHEKLGGGSSGCLYRGSYKGQECAVKVLSLALADEQGLLGDGHFSMSPCRAEGSSSGAHGQGGGCIPGLAGAGSGQGVGPTGLDSVSEASATPNLGSAQELLQCFKREVSIMRIIRHRNVLQFIGACSAWPRLFIVTELMAKGSIRDVLDKMGKGLSGKAALKVFRDAARGMDFLHRRGIVHRDLKAANLLIDENDVVKVCDFGVARLLPPRQAGAEPAGEAEEVVDRPPSPDRSMDMTAETGTYRWMAPEVLEHKPYGFKADVFSFGVTMWEVISGEIPYRGMTPLQAAVGVVQRSLRPPMPANTPPALANLIEACWHPSPQMRPSFSEVLTILEDIPWRSDSPPSKSPSSETRSSSGLSGLWKKTFGGRK